MPVLSLVLDWEELLGGIFRKAFLGLIFRYSNLECWTYVQNYVILKDISAFIPFEIILVEQMSWRFLSWITHIQTQNHIYLAKVKLYGRLGNGRCSGNPKSPHLFHFLLVPWNSSEQVSRADVDVISRDNPSPKYFHCQ